MEYEIFDAIFRFHIFDLAGKHQLIRLAYLANNVDKRVVVHFACNIKPFRIVIALDDAIAEWLI